MSSLGQKATLVPKQKQKQKPLFLLAELIFIRQRIKPIHKNNNRNLYSILCSLPKSILQAPQSLIATLVGSKDTFISLFYRQGNWDYVMLSESVQGHSVKLQSCDCQPAPQHTELIKVLWKKNKKQNSMPKIGKGWGEISLAKQKAAEGTDLPVGKAKTGSLVRSPKKRTKK